MAKNLVIVESPSKSKTIEKYLGSDYIVAFSKGHIRDLKTRGYGGFGVDVENNFKPMYKLLVDKQQIVRDLKKLCKTVDKVYLATDPDREGEAISWHLYDALDLQNKDCERIEFNEVTKTAVLEAIKNGREIDYDLVHSQESRRILDRIIGFSLSKLLQRKIGSKSAGRVQSVVLKLIVDREREIEAFKSDEYWDIYIEFNKKTRKLKAKLVSYNNDKIKLTSKDDTDKVLNSLNKDYIIEDIVKKMHERSPKPPFTTSTLQQEASSKLGFNAKKTMMLAQGLYEGIELGKERVGLITYMRTDSARLSEEFINSGKEYITKKYGESYYSGYKESAKKNSNNIQDAHEAIRPSRVNYTPSDVKAYLTNDEFKLYNLIYCRSLACLMKPAMVELQTLKVDNNGYKFEVGGELIKFDGYLTVYGNFEDDDQKSLPEMEIGEVINKVNVLPEQKFTSPPSRYTEGRLIRKMEELGIGRPSTYAITIETLKQRYYVKLEKKAFYPTKQGILTSDKLDEFFNSVINIKYTASMEDILDDISEGKKIWYEELRKFYDDFMPLVNEADEKMPKIYPILLEEKCPNCGSPLVMRNGKYGEFQACSAFPKCRYIKPKEIEETKKTNIKCPNCEKGYIVERISKRGPSKGKSFYACDQYPKCKTTYSSIEEINRIGE